MTIAVNPGSTMIGNYLERYQVWCDYHSYYHEPHKPLLMVSDHGIPCYHSTDLESINQNSQDPVVFIDNMTEAVHFYNKYFDRYRNDKHYVIFSEGWWDQDYYKIPLRYSQLYTHTFLFEMAENYLNPNRLAFYIDKEYDFQYPKSLQFVSTTGVARPERDWFVKELLNNVQYDNFVLRYNGQDLAQPWLDDVIDACPGAFDPYGFLPGLEKYYHYASQTVPLSLYNKAYFNVVAESNIDWPNQFHFTEKTIKVLVTGMPFVSLSSPGFLKNLHDLGFETYGTIWDESYDLEYNYEQRVSMIVDLINRLGTLDWTYYKKDLEKISQHNKVNFLSLNKQAVDQWQRLERCVRDLATCQLISI